MTPRPSSRRTPILLAALVATVAAAMALAIPATAHNGGGHGFGDRDPAGTIASFDTGTGVLTIDLAAGGSVSGLVTRWTWIDDDDDRCSGGDRHGRHRTQGWCRKHGSKEGRDHGHHWNRGDTDDLVPGATVDDAVLGLTDGRAFFVKVELED